MKDLLQDIIAHKKVEIERHKQAVNLHTLLGLGSDRMERIPYSMRQALLASSSGIIAEFKRKSPSKGWLHPKASIATAIPAYQQGGAAACSILTEGKFFAGTIGDLQKARRLTNLPLLQTDIFIDTYQLFQARVMGADAVLLIAAALTRPECHILAETAHSLQLEVVLEVQNEKELDYIDDAIDMVGINYLCQGPYPDNNENSLRLMELLQEKSSLLIAVNGVNDTETMAYLRQNGFKGFLTDDFLTISDATIF